MWVKPDWRLDPYPPLFGHPRNECQVWLIETVASFATFEQRKMDG